ncbi:MAG TPA: NAD(P)-dependent oxidoreductase, partial [Holophaga sp.]|nr:NAD(P)-dependent oxidoreductase [Holophaga sp.]
DCRRAAAGCAAAVMTAAVSVGAAGLKDRPWASVTGNLTMNAAMLEAFSQAGVGRVVFVGSATVYQPFDGSIAEDQLDLNQDPHSAYLGVGWAMRYLEKLCLFWHKATGIRFGVVRAANIYGPWSRFDPATANVIPALIRKAVARQDPFEVWGSPGVGRDVIFYRDFGRAVVRLLQSDVEYDVFNIGSGLKATVADMVQAALAAAGHIPGKVVYLGDQPTTIASRSLDCSKAARLLGWQCETPLAEGVARTAAWWRDNQTRWSK